MKKRIILIASSSGGHVFPILGIYELLKDDYDIKFIGIKNKFEEKLYPEDSLFLDIPSSFKLARKKDNKSKINKAINQINSYIKQDDLIISGGGFSSYLISKINHKKVIVLEQNRILGDANILLGRKAKLILSSFDLKFNPYFYKTKKIINPSVFRVDEKPIEKEELIIFIFGSLSSSSLIKTVVNYLTSSMINKKYKYIVVTGKYYNILKEFDFSKNITIIEKIDDINILKKAKLVFTRAGGTTLSELLYFNVPCVLIPSPYVKHNHQEKNAKYAYKKFNIPYILEKNFNNNTINHYINSVKNEKFRYFVEKSGKEAQFIRKIIDEII